MRKRLVFNVKKEKKMKKLVLIAATTAILASCSSESVFNQIKDETPSNPITFSSYSEKSSKADVGNNANANNLEYYHNSFAVFGTKVDFDNEIQYVFGDTAKVLGTTCTYTGNGDGTFYGTNWRYDEERFWDKYAYYDLIAYAPALPDTSLLRFRYSNTYEVDTLGKRGCEFEVPNYILKGTNPQQTMPQGSPYERFGVTANGDDIDLMISNIVSRRGTDQTTVQFAFHHIFSKLNISIAKTSSMNEGKVIIDSLIITGLSDKGSYVDSKYSNNPLNPRSGWTLAAANANPNFELAYRRQANHPAELPDEDTDGVHPLYFIESLILPQNISNNAKLSLKYHITKDNGTYSENFKYEIAFKEIFAQILDRSLYTIKFSLNSDAITFDANADAWDIIDKDYNILPQPDPMAQP